MAKLSSNIYYTDNDSGLGFDYDYHLSNNSSRTNIQSFPITGFTGQRKLHQTPLIKFPSDGIIERIRPATMKNSENSDFIICQTNRDAYVAYRTPIVPAWVTKLVNDIEREQR